MTNSSPLNHNLLNKIQEIFETYDSSAINAQKRFIFLRLLILRLSVLVTLLAVLQSEFKHYQNEVDMTLWLRQYVSFIPNVHQLIEDGLNFLVILAPISVSILLAGTVKFGRGVNWILLRSSAETIKQEIYRYRTQVGDYRDPATRDINFAEEIKNLNERLMKTQVNQASLTWNSLQKNKGKRVQKPNFLFIIIYGFWKFLNKLRQRTINIFFNFIDKHFKNKLWFRFIRRQLRDSRPKKLSVVNEVKDDFYSVLKPEQYLRVRLIEQLNWYRRKTLDLDKKWQRRQWFIYFLGGVGTFLAAIKWDVWIAVSNAVAASILSFLEFQRLDSTLTGYNQTATNLENIVCWWHALTEKEKNDPKNIEKLVENSEKVIRSETTGWVQEMKDAMADLYKIDEEARKAEKTEKNVDEKADGDGKSANMENFPKQEGAGPNLS